jgi:SNF2 family DNA or RNA helicase
MGSGKTKPIIDNASELFRRQEIDGLLIISDNGAYRNWVDYEVPKHLPEWVPNRMAAWSSHMRARQQYQANQLLVAKDDVLDILAMNVEAFAHENAPVFAEAFLQSHYAMMVVDESSSIKNLKAKRTQRIIELGKYAEYRRIMDGTPITNSPLDLFSQFEFLRAGILGFDNFFAFRGFFAKLMLIDAGRGKKYYQITGYQNLDYLSKKIAPHSSRLLKSQCLDLPEKIYETCEVEHTEEQARVYSAIRQEAIAMFENGTVTATSAITALVKLHQVNCGHVKDDDGEVRRLPSNRVITESLPLGSWVDYYGPTPEEKRQESISLFKKLPEIKYFVSSPATGGRGITLTEAHTVIYYSQSFNLAHRVQSEDRCHRPGQRNNVTYIDMVVRGTVDTKIVGALRQKKDLASMVLDQARQFLLIEDEL